MFNAIFYFGIIIKVPNNPFFLIFLHKYKKASLSGMPILFVREKYHYYKKAVIL